MSDYLSTKQIVLISIGTGAIYPIFWTFRRVRQLVEELEFEDQSLN